MQCCAWRLDGWCCLLCVGSLHGSGGTGPEPGARTEDQSIAPTALNDLSGGSGRITGSLPEVVPPQAAASAPAAFGTRSPAFTSTSTSISSGTSSGRPIPTSTATSTEGRPSLDGQRPAVATQRPRIVSLQDFCWINEDLLVRCECTVNSHCGYSEHCAFVRHLPENPLCSCLAPAHPFLAQILIDLLRPFCCRVLVPLPGAETLPAESIQSSFTHNSFELEVRGLAPDIVYRLAVDR